jgi:hypothetical protein
MAYVHSTRGTAFKLEFYCMRFLMGDGKSRRGLIIGHSPLPGDPRHLNCVVAFEDGGVMPKVVRRDDFDKAARQNDHITLVEAPDMHGKLALVGAGGTTITDKPGS